MAARNRNPKPLSGGVAYKKRKSSPILNPGTNRRSPEKVEREAIAALNVPSPWGMALRALNMKCYGDAFARGMTVQDVLREGGRILMEEKSLPNPWPVDL